MLLLSFLLFLPVVEAAVTDFLGTPTFALAIALVLIFLFIGYWRKKHVTGDLSEKSAVGGFLGSVIKWPFVKMAERWGRKSENTIEKEEKEEGRTARLFKRLKRKKVSGDENQEMHDELLSDAVLKKAAAISKRVNRWEIGRDKLMQVSEKNIAVQISMMVNDLDTLTQLEASFAAAFKQLQARKRERLPYSKKAISQLYKEKKRMGVKLKELTRKLSSIQQFYASLGGEAEVQMDYDHEEKKFAEFEVGQLRTMVDEERTHIEHIRKSIGEGGDDKQINELRKLEEEKEELTRRALKVMKQKETELADAEREEKKVASSVKERQKVLEAIQKLASELYKGTQGFGAQLSEKEIIDISEEIRRKIPDIYPNAHKAWFHFEGKGIEDRTDIMRKLHEKIEEINEEGALIAENKDKILPRIKRLFSTDEEVEEALGPRLVEGEEEDSSDSFNRKYKLAS